MAASVRYTDVEVGVRRYGTVDAHKTGVIARWVDSSNHLKAHITGNTGTFEVLQVLAGSPVTVCSIPNAITLAASVSSRGAGSADVFWSP